jgi:alkylated DNA repair dioxygenase AlkB
MGYHRDMTVMLQGSLLDPELWASPETAACEPLGLAGAHHVELGAGAWVEHLPNWLPGADEIFDRLAENVPWKAERRRMYDRVVDVPRLVAWYSAGAQLPHRTLATARQQLSTHYDIDLVTAGLCYYRDGRDSVAWHGDRIGRGATTDTVVAIVSVGEPRALILRPREGGDSTKFELGHGDLFVMGGSCQRTFDHAVPKSARPVGPRISIQFRPQGVA